MGCVLPILGLKMMYTMQHAGADSLAGDMLGVFNLSVKVKTYTSALFIYILLILHRQAQCLLWLWSQLEALFLM